MDGVKAIFFDRCGRLRSGFQLLLALALMIVLQVLPGFAAVFLQTEDSLWWVAVYLLATLATVAAFGLLFRLLFKRQDTTSMDSFRVTGRGSAHLAAGMAFGAIAFSLAALPMYISGHYVISFNGVHPVLLAVTFALFIFVGFIEEITTRGAMQHALMRFGKWPSLLIISLIFGLLHMANPGVTVASIVGVSMAGLMLGLAMYATNSIAFSIGIHITWNWVQGAVYGIPVSGTVGEGSLFATQFVGDNTLITGGAFGTEASLSCNIVLLLLCVALVVYGRKRGRFAVYDRDRQATRAAKQQPRG